MAPDADHRLAVELAAGAGEHLVELQQNNLMAGNQGWWLGEDADVEANERILRELASARPTDAVLSEESPDDPGRLTEARAWVIDPLDGSGGFAYGSADWAVHVALTVDGRCAAAAVAVPSIDEVFSTAEPRSVPERAPDRPPRVVVGRSRLGIDGQRVAAALDGELHTCGSAGFKAMLVVAGEMDVYVHASPLYEWDVCAPAGVAAAAGLHVSDAVGRPLHYNQPRPVVPGIVICRPELSERVLAGLRG